MLLDIQGMSIWVLIVRAGEQKCVPPEVLGHQLPRVPVIMAIGSEFQDFFFLFLMFSLEFGNSAGWAPV